MTKNRLYCDNNLEVFIMRIAAYLKFVDISIMAGYKLLGKKCCIIMFDMESGKLERSVEEIGERSWE